MKKYFFLNYAWSGSIAKRDIDKSFFLDLKAVASHTATCGKF